MRGIISLLDNTYTELVNELWRDMVADCSVTNKHLPPLPHFSWSVFDDCDIERLDEVLVDIAGKTTPFTVRTSGVGIFTGENPVIYVALIKDEKLMRFQEMLWYKTASYSTKTSPYYIPDFWMPHITLVNGANEKKNILCALDKLMRRNCVWEFKITCLAVIGDSNGEGINGKYLYKFKS